MKLLALLFLVGFAAASGEWEWNTGKDYVFEYRGRLITGFPKLASQYSGLGLRAKIVIRVLEPDHLLMMVEEPKSVEVNDILKTKGDSSTYGPEGTNWRHLELPKSKPVPEEFRKILSMPVKIRFAYDGEVTSLVFESMEPEWSINFKKGLISLFQTKINSYSMEIEESRHEDLGMPLNGTSTWKVKEQSIDGICENQYSLSQLPKFYIKEHPETVPTPEACENPKRLFRITKLRNTDNCEKRSLYSFFKPGYFNCRGEMGANCSPMWSRSSYTTYIACQGSRASSRSSSEYPASRLVIQSVVNEAELSSNLFGYSTEKIVTGNRQILKLLEIRPHSSSVEEYSRRSGSSGGKKTVTTLMYDFFEPRMRDQSSGMEHLDRKDLLRPEIVAKTNQYLFAKDAGVHISKEELIVQIEELLTEVARDLKSSASKMIEAHVNMKLLGIAKGLAMFKEPGMFMEIYSKIAEDPVKVNLFFDTVTISGTPNAVAFIKEMMMTGKMTRLQKGQFFMWMPQYLISPSKSILHSLFDLVKSEAIQGPQVCPVVKGLAYSALSRLIHTACISDDRLNTYPTWVYGEFCSPDSEIVNNRWVPFLEDKVRSGRPYERNIAIMSLGMVAKKRVIPTLLSVIQGRTLPTGRGSSSPKVMPSTARQLALYSLVSVGFRAPNMVAPILVSVMKDPSESLEMRVAAFNGLMRMGPPSVHILHDIVGMTHQEVGLNPELLKVINIGLYTAGNQELHSNMEYRTVEMIKNARMAHHMVKKIKGIYPTSATYFSNAYLERLGVGYDAFLTYVRGQETFLPKHIFAEIKYLLLNFNIKPIEIGLNFGHTHGRLHEKLAEVLSSKEKLQEAIQEHLSEGLNKGWRQIVQQLKDESSSYMPTIDQDDEFSHEDPALFVKIFESSFLYFNFDTLTSSSPVKQLVQEFLHHIKSGQPFTSDKRVEVQKVMDLVPLTVTIPSDMGFPIHIRLHYPVTFSFSGNVRTRLTAEAQSVDFSGKVVLASQMTGYVGTHSPFTKELVCTGVDQHSVLDLPGQIEIKASIPEQKLSVNFRRLDSEGQSRLDVVHFHVIPFTVRSKLGSLKPLVKSPEFKPIESEMKPYEKEMTFGESLGLVFKMNYKTESAFKGLSSVWELMSVYKKCPLNMLAFSWVSPALTPEAKPSIRKHKFTVGLDTSASTTKEIKMEFKLGYSSRMRSSDPHLYHRIHVLPQVMGNNAYYGEGLEGFESPLAKIIKKYLPYRLKSESLEEALSAHPKRAQKIKEVLEKIALKEEQALEDMSSSSSSPLRIFSLISSVTLVGSARPMTWSYTTTFGYGGSKVSSPEYVSSLKDNMKMMQKWSMVLESSHGKKICINGRFTVPILPMWNINDLKTTLSYFELKNVVGFGDSDCRESTVETTGRFLASEKQSRRGLKSLEAEECLRLTSVHGHSRHSICKKAIDLATTVDVVEIDSRFKNVKPYVSKVESRIIDFLRGYLWPYLLVDKKNPSSHVAVGEDMRTYETKTKIEFHQTTPSFDLVIKRPTEELRFENVHILSPYRVFFPLKTGRRVDTVARSSSLTYSHGHEGSSERRHHHHHHHKSEEYLEMEELMSLQDWYYRCRATPENVKTYRNRTIPYKQYYGCEHLLTGDCGKVKHFFVSEVLHRDGRKTVKINLRDSWVEIVGKESDSMFEVRVDGREINLVKGSSVELRDNSGSVIGKVAYYTTNEFPLMVMLPKYFLDEVLFDGTILEIRPNPAMKEFPMCGLCGNLKSMSSIRSLSADQVCEYSTPELTMASHRIGSVSDECPRLEEPLKEQLKLEKKICLEGSYSHRSYNPYKHSSYSSLGDYEVSENRCSVLKHVIVNKSNEVCISKTPLLHCGRECKAANHVEKTVPFICLPEGRMAEYYLEKVREGKILKELHSMEESYTKEMKQVHHCIPL